MVRSANTARLEKERAIPFRSPEKALKHKIHTPLFYYGASDAIGASLVSEHFINQVGELHFPLWSHMLIGLTSGEAWVIVMDCCPFYYSAVLVLLHFSTSYWKWWSHTCPVRGFFPPCFSYMLLKLTPVMCFCAAHKMQSSPMSIRSEGTAAPSVTQGLCAFHCLLSWFALCCFVLLFLFLLLLFI